MPRVIFGLVHGADGAVVFGMQLRIGRLLALEELLRLRIGHHAHVQNLELSRGIRIFLQALLFGLRGQQLHADQLVQDLVLLIGASTPAACLAEGP